MPQARGGLKALRLPSTHELIHYVPMAAAGIVLLALGAAISALMPKEAAGWMSTAAFFVPACIAFTAWWWATQRD